MSARIDLLNMAGKLSDMADGLVHLAEAYHAEPFTRTEPANLAESVGIAAGVDLEAAEAAERLVGRWEAAFAARDFNALDAQAETILDVAEALERGGVEIEPLRQRIAALTIALGYQRPERLRARADRVPQAGAVDVEGAERFIAGWERAVAAGDSTGLDAQTGNIRDVAVMLQRRITLVAKLHHRVLAVVERHELPAALRGGGQRPKP